MGHANKISFFQSILNPFVPNAPFLYPLKTSENRKGVEKGCIWNKCVNMKYFKWINNMQSKSDSKWILISSSMQSHSVCELRDIWTKIDPEEQCSYLENQKENSKRQETRNFQKFWNKKSCNCDNK